MHVLQIYIIHRAAMYMEVFDTVTKSIYIPKRSDGTNVPPPIQATGVKCLVSLSSNEFMTILGFNSMVFNTDTM